jgi:hypothetical protein
MAPKVPLYQPQVREQALPGVRFNADAPIEAFGGGQSASGVFAAAQELGQQAEKMALEEKRKADDLVTQQAWARTNEYKNTLFYDPKEGAITRKGIDAINVTEEYGTKFDKFADDLESTMNADQRAVYRKIRTQARADLNGDLLRHSSGEYIRYQDEVFAGGMKAAHDEAVLSAESPERFARALQAQEALIIDHAHRQGKSGSWVKPQLAEARSKVYTGVVMSYLNTRQDGKAADFYKRYKDQIADVESRLKIEAGLSEIEALNKAQFLAHTIIAKTKDPLEQYNLSIEMTKKDPRAQDKVQELLREYNTAQKAEIDLQSRVYAEKVWKQLKSGVRFDDIPIEDRMGLRIEDENKFRSYDKNKFTQNLQKTSYPEYERLMKLAARDQKAFIAEDIATNTLMLDGHKDKLIALQKLTATNLDQVLEKTSGWNNQERIMSTAMDRGRIFDRDQRARIAEIIRNRFSETHSANPKASLKEFTDIANEEIDLAVREGIIRRTPPKPPRVPKPAKPPTFSESLVNSVVQESGIKDAKKHASIRAAVRQYWEINTGRTKRDMTETEMAELTRLMATPVDIEINWWPDKKKLAGELTLEDAPAGYIDALRRDLGAKGQPTDDAAVLSIFRRKAAESKGFKR